MRAPLNGVKVGLERERNALIWMQLNFRDALLLDFIVAEGIEESGDLTSELFLEIANNKSAIALPPTS